MNRLFLIFIPFFFLIENVNSQDTLNKKPVVALVLSGGTAKGLSHIGVLKVLEELDIRPDIIVGTSMGSIIGGLYALGYSASEIEEITLKTDWFKYLSNNPDLSNINIEEKDDFGEFIYNFPVEKRKPSLGKGIIYGHEIGLYLNRVTFPAYQYSSYDDFPIKFRAIATDVIKSESYVFKEGSLSRALRASMSIPTLFSPVEYKGMVLVDGGILDNFGVDIALKNNADIIIGSNVERIIRSNKNVSSYKNMISILMMIESKNKYQKYKDSVDVLIESPVIEMGSRFDKTKEIIEIGYQTAKKHYDELKAVKAKLADFSVDKSTTKINTENVKYHISQLAVRGINDISYKYRIFNRLRKSIGEEADYKSIEHEITDLYRSGQFEYIKYYIEKVDEKNYKLVFDFAPKAKNYLQLGIHYNDQVDIGIVVGLTSRNDIISNSKFKFKGRISKYPGIDQYFIKYFNDKSKFGLKQFFSYTNDRLPIFENNSKLTSFKRNYFTTGMSGIFIQNNSSMWELGYNYNFMSLNSEFKSEYQEINSAEINQNKIYLSYYRNTLDEKFFANSGMKINTYVNYNFLNSIYISKIDGIHRGVYPNNYIEAGLNLDYYLKLNNRWVMESTLVGKYSGSYVRNNLFVLKNPIGGVYPDNNKQEIFWGYPDNYFLTNSIAIIRTAFRYKLTDRIYLKPAINVAVFDDYLSDLGGGVSISYNSPIGPLSASITKSLEYNVPIFHLSIGYFR